jgi:cysteine-rich repeat protein
VATFDGQPIVTMKMSARPKATHITLAICCWMLPLVSGCSKDSDHDVETVREDDSTVSDSDSESEPASVPAEAGEMDPSTPADAARADSGPPEEPDTELLDAAAGTAPDAPTTLPAESDGGLDGGSTAADGEPAWRSTCGNGALDTGEMCDDGARLNGDGCDEDCCAETTLILVCVNGWSPARIRPCHCGDGVVDDTEICDDGNLESGDGCSAYCTRESSTCGNGEIDDDEACDDGNHTSGDGCDPTCVEEVSCTPNGEAQPAPQPEADAGAGVCGNGIVEASEQCDDANEEAGDGCDTACTLECGNGVIEGSESCDDGNRVSGDGCSATCSQETRLDQ